jgi:hypothetical protein
VPRRSSRRSGSRTSPIGALVALAIFAILAGWVLLRPKPHVRSHHEVALQTPVPVATLLPASAPALTPIPPTTLPSTVSPGPQESPAPSSSPTALPSASENPNGPELALIVDDCGQWIDTERGFVALDVPLTLSVLPHVRYGGKIAREAAQAGKGVMLHLPMETLSGLYPGPGEITTTMSDAEIVAQVQDDLAQVPLANGVNNHEGSKASADPRVMRDVIGVLAQHGLFFIDSRTNAASVGESTARDLGVPTAARDVFLDNRADVAYSEAQLLQAAAIARKEGSAIAIGHPRPTTLAAVAALLPQLRASGIRFVLASELTSK